MTRIKCNIIFKTDGLILIFFFGAFSSPLPHYTCFFMCREGNFFLNPFCAKLTEEKHANLFSISFTWPRSLHEEMKLSIETVRPVYFYAVWWRVKVKVFLTVRLLFHGILQARILEWVAASFSRDFPDPTIKLQSPVL